MLPKPVYKHWRSLCIKSYTKTKTLIMKSSTALLLAATLVAGTTVLVAYKISNRFSDKPKQLPGKKQRHLNEAFARLKSTV